MQCARNEIRTRTSLRMPPPQDGASTNFATRALNEYEISNNLIFHICNWEAKLLFFSAITLLPIELFLRLLQYPELSQCLSHLLLK